MLAVLIASGGHVEFALSKPPAAEQQRLLHDESFEWVYIQARRSGSVYQRVGKDGLALPDGVGERLLIDELSIEPAAIEALRAHGIQAVAGEQGLV